MIDVRTVVIASCFLVSAGALAQSDAKKAEDLKNSSEMMKPQTNAPANSPTKAPMATPLSEADKKAEEAQKSSEMMKPQTSAPASTGRAQTIPETNDAERKAADARKKSEMMKPQ